MKKILLFLSFLLMSIGVWGGTVTFTKFDFTGQGTANTGSEVTATKDGVTFTFSKGYCADESLRCYAHGALSIISETTIEKINFTTTGGKTGGLNAEVTVGATSYSVADLASQARFTQIDVTLSGGTTIYTVTYNSNGGSVTPESYTQLTEEEDITLPTPIRDGYTFTGWYTEPSGGNKIGDAGDSYTPTSDITLFAQWEEIVVPPTPVGDCMFSESFTESTGTMGWSGSAASGTFKSDNDGWAAENSYGAGGSAKFGTGSKQGSAETPSIPYNGSNDLILTFNSGAWNGSSEVTTVNLSASNATLTQNSITLTKGSWTTYTIKLTNVSNNFKIKWEASTVSNNRFFLDDICISEDETCLPSISVTKIEQGGTFDLSSDSVCENGSVTLSNIMPSEGYKFDTIICLAQDGEEFVEHGTVNISNSTISGITKDCYVVVIFSQLPPEPEVEIVEWNPDYIKVDIDNFNAVTAVIENKNTQLNVENTATELFFSKYFEAAGNNKMIAIYNGTTDTLDLSKYYISKAEATPTVLELGQFGRLSGYILPSEEIIFARFDNTHSAKPCADTLDGFSNWVQYMEGDKSAPAGFHNTLTFGGRASLGLYKKGVSVDTLIDVIGSHYDGTLMRIGKQPGTKDNPCASAMIGEYNDDAGYYTYTGDSVHGNSDNYFLSTNRCLLIRKNTVHSGDTAVKYNVYDTFDDCGVEIAESFVTLSNEWMGFRIGTGSSSSEEINSLTCSGLSELGRYDYGNYYAQYTQVGEKIILGKTEPDGSYKIDINNLDTLSCTYLKVIVNDNSNNSEECEYKIPIFVTENINSNSLISQEGDDCPECDVVIINGGKLTVNSTLANRDVTVYPGGVLVIPDGETYKVNSLTLRRENNEVPYFSYKGHLVLTDKFYIDLRTDADDWRWMTLPFSHKVSDIKMSNGKPINLNNDVWLSYYDGKYRSINEKNAWKDVLNDTTFNAGEGFLFGVDLPGHSKKTYRFSFHKDTLENEKQNKTIKNLFAWGGENENLAPNHKGWNLIGNPFMDNDTTDIITPIRIGRLKRDSVNGQWTGGWVVDSVTTKLRYAVVPNKDEKFADAGYYESVVLDGYVIKPLTSFFVQLGGNEEDMQTLTFKPEKRINRIVARNYQMLGDDETFLRIKVDNWKTGCFISNKFTEDYEPGDDLESRYKIYQSIGGYKLLYSAINDSIIENGVKITAPSGKLYLDEKTNIEEFEYIYVLYNDNWYDLLRGETVNVGNGDFILQAKRKRCDITTDINHVPTQGLYKYTDGTNIYINKNNCIFNIIGSKIK